MPYVCKNRCGYDAFKGEGVLVVPRRAYGGGAKRCGQCDYFCITDLLACPCCGRRFNVEELKNPESAS